MTAPSPRSPLPDMDMARVAPADGMDLNAFFDCLEDSAVTLVAAHRGGALENSIPGMAATLSKVPAMMEVDVATSSDGVLFLLHDDTLERTTTGTGMAAEQDWATLRDLNLKDENGEPTSAVIPTLADALAWARGRTILELDIKRSTRYEDVIETVRRQNAEGHTLFIAYTLGQAQRLHSLAPDMMISLTLDEPGELDEAVRAGIPSSRLLGWTGNTEPAPAVFDELNAEDVEVIFGTLGGEDSIDNRMALSGNTAFYAELSLSGVDIIATDRAAVAFNAMKEAGLTVSDPACGVVEAEQSVD